MIIIIKDLGIASLNCNTQSDVQISFKILENRKKTIKIFMTVDGEAIISPEYSTGKSFDLSSGTDLPWEGAYSVTWDGKFANGQYPSVGEHTLYVSVEDEDGNVSEVAQHQFTIGTGPLTISGSETITRNSSAQYTATGCPNNVEWSVSGTGATISSTGLLTAGSTACGSLLVTATCAACGTSESQYVRVTNNGTWEIVNIIKHCDYGIASRAYCLTGVATMTEYRTAESHWMFDPTPCPVVCNAGSSCPDMYSWHASPDCSGYFIPVVDIRLAQTLFWEWQCP